MSVLKIESKRKEYKLVGVSLPPREHTYMSLYCMAKGITKTTILKSQIEDWICVRKKQNPEIELIKEVARRVIQEWREEHQQTPTLTFTQYKKNVKEELFKKLPVNYITAILQEITNYAKNN